MNNIFRRSIPVAKNLWPVCFFFALSALYLGETQNSIFVERDLLRFFIPPRQFWVEEIKNFTFPLWNPFYYNGHPLFATLQPGVLYPFSALYLFLPFNEAFNLNIEIHFALAGWFTYLLLRGMKASHGAALISGIGFMLSGYLLSIHSFLNTFLSVPWVPLLILVFFAGVKKNHYGYALISGALGTCMFLGGGIEICYMTFGVILFLIIFPELVIEKESFPPSLKQRLALFAVFIVTMLGLSAIQILPMLELSKLSLRSEALSYAEAGIWSLHPLDLLELFLPDQYGLGWGIKNFWTYQNMLKTIYMGAIPFLLSLFLIKKNKKLFLGFLFLFLVSLVFALGKHTFLHYYLYEYLPLFNKLRFPVKFIFMAIIVLCITAGLGYDSFKQEAIKNNNKTLPLLFLVLGFLCMLGFGILNLFHNEFVAYFDSIGWSPPKYNEITINIFNIKRLLVFTSLLCVCIYLYFQPKFQKPHMLVLLVSVFILDLFYFHVGFYVKLNIEKVNQPAESTKFIKSDPSLFRIYTNSKIENSSYTPGGSKWDALSVNKEIFGFGMLGNQKIFQTQGVAVTRQKRVEIIDEFIKTDSSLDKTQLLNLMNVKYIISIPELTSPDFKKVFESYPELSEKSKIEGLEQLESVGIYENKNVLPRAFLVPFCKVVSKNIGYAGFFKGKQFDPRAVVLLDKEPKGFDCIEKGETGSQGSVQIETYKSNSVDLLVTSNRRQFLFMSDSYYPGWKAYVNGEGKEILRANYLFRALLIEPGTHKIRFEYDPLSFKLGLIISLLTVLFCGAYFLNSIRKKKICER